MKLSTSMILAVSAFALANSTASAALISFDGLFAPTNWTLAVSNGGDGSVNTTGAPSSITLISSNNGNANDYAQSDVDFTISAPFTGTVDFYWSYSTADWDPSYDPFYFLLNGTEIAIVDDGANQQNGFASFAVEMGDLVGFRLRATDSDVGSATTIISSSDLSAVPEPGSALALGLLIGSGAFLRNRRRPSSAA